MASPNAVAAPARMLRAVRPRAMRRWRRDAQLVVTLGLLAPITIVALGRNPEPQLLAAVAVVAVALQLFLGIAERRSSRMRTTDLVARYGGEEFAAVLFRADLADATQVADEVRCALGAIRITTPDGIVTASVSAGCSAIGSEPATANQLVRAADVALSMAKRAGRDRVVATSGV